MNAKAQLDCMSVFNLDRPVGMFDVGGLYPDRSGRGHLLILTVFPRVCSLCIL